MHWLEAERIAAKQAAHLRRLSMRAGLDPARFIATLPAVRVEHDPALPDNRTSYWDDTAQQWVIVIGSDMPASKRRFGILHEFKRILDHGHDAHLYDPRYLQGLVQAEMAGDHFASTALLPASDIRDAVNSGDTAAEIAHRFGVTRLRVKKRLSDLNLLQPSHLERRQP